jgi:ABC-type branched-subunit amino acid transport system substrate-binding protein
MTLRARHVGAALTIAALAASIAPATNAATATKTTKKATTKAKAKPKTTATTAAPTTAAPTTAAPTTAPKATTPAAAAVNYGGFDAGTKTIKIGFSGILTGPFAFLGTVQRNSIQVEIDRINNGGGLGGAKIELVVRDDGGSPANAVRNAREFSDDKSVAFVIGPSLTGNFDATKGIYEDNKKVNCQPAVSGESGFGTTLKYSFRSQDRGTDLVPLLLTYLKEQGVGTMGMVYTNNATGKNFDKLIPEQADKTKIVWAGTQFTQASDQTHTAQMKELLDTFNQRKGEKSAIFIDNDQNALKTLAAGKAAKYEGIYVGGSGLQNYAFVDAVGDDMIGATFEAPYLGYYTRIAPADQPKMYAQHVADVIAKFGEDVGPRTGVKQYRGTAIAADCVVMFARGAAVAKSIDADKVVDAMETFDIPGSEMPSGMRVKFGKGDHEPYGQEDLWIWRWAKDAKGYYLEVARKADSSK